jgi:O-antigen/teichoic acid export membrane protein
MASSDDRLSFEEPGIKETNGFSPQEITSGFTFQVLTYAPALVIPGLVNFLALALYTRFLSSEAYGRYAFVMAVVIVVKMVAFDWIRMGLFRFFQSAQRDGRLPALISTTMAGFVIISFFLTLAWVVILPLMPLDDEKLRSGMWLGLPLLLIWALFEQILQINRAAIAPVRYGLLSVSRAILCLGTALCFIRVLHLDEAGLMLGLILGTVVPTLADLVRWRVHMIPRLVERGLTNDLLRYSMPFVVIFSLDFVPSISNRFLLQHFLGSGAVGLFAAGYDLGNQTVMMLFVSLNMAAYPLVIRSLEHAGKVAVREQLCKYSIVVFATVLPVSVLMALLAQPISTLVLGEAFRRAGGQLIPWAAMSTFLMGAKAFYFDLAFQLGLRTEFQIWAAAAAALLNVVLGLWWIPIYGLMGAVWATCAAYTLASIISLGLGRKVFRLPFPAWDLVRVGLATLLMVIVLLLTSPNSNSWIGLVGTLGLAAAVYTIAVWIMDVGHIRQRGPVVTLSWIIKNNRDANSRTIK